MQVTIKDIESEERLHLKSTLSISGADFLNNIQIPQVRVKIRETEHDTTFETSSQLTLRISPSIVL